MKVFNDGNYKLELGVKYNIKADFRCKYDHAINRLPPCEDALCSIVSQRFDHTIPKLCLEYSFNDRYISFWVPELQLIEHIKENFKIDRFKEIKHCYE